MNRKIITTLFLLLVNIATIACSQAEESTKQIKNSQTATKVILGIDKLIQSNFAEIKGKNVGLFTNFSGRTNGGLLTAEILANSKAINLQCIFSPEHGFYGGSHAGECVNNSEVFGVRMISLYGATRRPKLEDVQKLDVVLIDIQDIGIRSYTFLSSVNYMLTACAEAGVPAIVLDRPNPIGGNTVDGSVTEKGAESFVSLLPVSYIHGLTLGEISIMMNEEGWLKNDNGEIQKCDLTVIKMDGWERNMRWEDCNLFWFPTSPQIPSPEAVYGAATLGIFGELSLFNIGIGTSLPFRYLGFPEMNELTVFEEINKFKNDDELLIQIAHFKPFYGKFSQQNCRGFIFLYPKTNSYKPYTTGVQTILAIRKVHPEMFDKSKIIENRKNMFEKVTGGSKLFDAIFDMKDDDEVITVAQKGLKEFIELRKKYLIYR